MGNTLWVDVEGRAKDDLPGDNSIMLQVMNSLDGLCRKLRVAKLSDFYDYSALEDEFGEYLGDEEGVKGDEESDNEQASGSWFDPGPVLIAVRTIRSHLEQHPEALHLKLDASSQHWPNMLMEELAECETALAEAVAQGRRFRFLIVP